MPTKLLRRKLRKNAHFLSRITIFASDNSERSLAIQNNVLQSTSLISKSLPIRIAPNGNLLLLSQIARNQKIREELFSSNGGTLRFLGKKSKTLRTYDLILPEFQLILPKFHLILPKFHCLAYLRRGCVWRVRLPEKVPPPPTADYSYSLYPPIVAIIPSYDTSHTRCLTSIEVLWMQYGLLFNDLSRDKNSY